MLSIYNLTLNLHNILPAQCVYWSAAARYAALCLLQHGALWTVEHSDEYLCTGRAYRMHIVE